MKKIREYSYLALVIAVAIFGGLEMLIIEPEHGAGGFLAIPGAMAILGLVGCLVLTGLAKWAGHHLLERDENYYDDKL